MNHNRRLRKAVMTTSIALLLGISVFAQDLKRGILKSPSGEPISGATMSDAMPGMNKAQFQRQLEHERIMELTGESLRWNDLARWGYFDDAAKLNELKARDPEFNNFVIGRNKYMPIH